MQRALEDPGELKRRDRKDGEDDGEHHDRRDGVAEEPARIARTVTNEASDEGPCREPSRNGHPPSGAFADTEKPAQRI
jgi:hypothetical protein